MRILGKGQPQAIGECTSKRDSPGSKSAFAFGCEELRRMKDQEKLEEFERFEAAHAKAVCEKVLKARREAEGPNWRPNSLEGMFYQSQVRKTLRSNFGRRPG
jgi:hypothetical protein